MAANMVEGAPGQDPWHAAAAAAQLTAAAQQSVEQPFRSPRPSMADVTAAGTTYNIPAEQMALLLQTLQQAQSQGGGGGEDEFRRAWKGLPLPTLREGPDWADWNFKWKTVCAEAHGMIIMLVEQAEHCHTAHVGPYQDARQERAARSAYARLSSCTEAPP